MTKIIDHFFRVFFFKSYRMVWNLQPYSEDWSYLFTTVLHFCKWIFFLRFRYHFEIYFPSIGRLFKIKKSPNTKLFTKINSTGCKIDWTKQFSHTSSEYYMKVTNRWCQIITKYRWNHYLLWRGVKSCKIINKITHKCKIYVSSDARTRCCEY